jgi:hypothetical protein
MEVQLPDKASVQSGPYRLAWRRHHRRRAFMLKRVCVVSRQSSKDA